MLMPAVDVGLLFEVAVASLVAAIGFSTIFSIAVMGAARAADMRRADRSMAAAAYTGLTMLALAISVAAVVAGLVVMTRE